MWNEAAEDGRMCIITDKSFVKGYFRQALALQNLVGISLYEILTYLFLLLGQS